MGGDFFFQISRSSRTKLEASQVVFCGLAFCYKPVSEAHRRAVTRELVAFSGVGVGTVFVLRISPYANVVMWLPVRIRQEGFAALQYTILYLLGKSA